MVCRIFRIVVNTTAPHLRSQLPFVHPLRRWQCHVGIAADLWRGAAEETTRKGKEDILADDGHVSTSFHHKSSFSLHRCCQCSTNSSTWSTNKAPQTSFFNWKNKKEAQRCQRRCKPSYVPFFTLLLCDSRADS